MTKEIESAISAELPITVKVIWDNSDLPLSYEFRTDRGAESFKKAIKDGKLGTVKCQIL